MLKRYALIIIAGVFALAAAAWAGPHGSAPSGVVYTMCSAGTNLGDGCNDTTVATNVSTSGYTLTVSGTITGPPIAPGMTMTVSGNPVVAAAAPNNGNSGTWCVLNGGTKGPPATGACIGAPLVKPIYIISNGGSPGPTSPGSTTVWNISEPLSSDLSGATVTFTASAAAATGSVTSPVFFQSSWNPNFFKPYGTTGTPYTTTGSAGTSGSAIQIAGHSFNASALAALNWNVAGVNYPVGFNPASLPAHGLCAAATLCDPANIEKDPWAFTSGTTHDTHGCTYSSTPYPIVNCNADDGYGYLIEGYDFTQHGGVAFKMNTGSYDVTGAVIVKNNKIGVSIGNAGLEFKMGNCAQTLPCANPQNVIFIGNYIDTCGDMDICGVAAPSYSMAGGTPGMTQTTQIEENNYDPASSTSYFYNYFGYGNRFAQANTNIIFRQNYAEGFNCAQGAVITGTLVGTTLTVNSVLAGNVVVGLALATDETGGPNDVHIVSGSGTSWTMNHAMPATVGDLTTSQIISLRFPNHGQMWYGGGGNTLFENVAYDTQLMPNKCPTLGWTFDYGGGVSGPATDSAYYDHLVSVINPAIYQNGTTYGGVLCHPTIGAEPNCGSGAPNNIISGYGYIYTNYSVTNSFLGNIQDSTYGSGVGSAHTCIANDSTTMTPTPNFSGNVNLALAPASSDLTGFGTCAGM